MTTSIEERLQHYLDRLAGGETIADMLPEIEAEPEGAELAQLVALSAQAMEVLPRPLPAARRGRMQAELQAAFSEAHPKREARAGAFAGLFHGWLRPVPRLTALVLAFVLLATTGVVVRAEDSVPGDALYPVKRVAESARMVFTVDPLRRARLQLRLADRRLDELQRLADRGAAIDARLIDDLLDRHAAILDETRRLHDPGLVEAAREVMQKHRALIGALTPSIEDPQERERIEQAGDRLRGIEDRLPTAVAAPLDDAPDASIPFDPTAEDRVPGARKSRTTPGPGRSLATSVRALPTSSPISVPATPTESAGAIAPQPGPSLLPPGSTPLPPSAEPPGSVMTALPGTPIERPTRPARETAEAARRATRDAIERRATKRAERKATEQARDKRIRMATEEAERRKRAGEATRRAIATKRAETPEPRPTRPDWRPTPTPDPGHNDLTAEPPPAPSPTDEPTPSETP